MQSKFVEAGYRERTRLGGFAKRPRGRDALRQKYELTPQEHLEQITQSYDVNGTRHPAGAFEPAIIARLARTNDLPVREVAQTVPDLKLLQTLSRLQNDRVQSAFDAQAKQTPYIMAGKVIQAMSSPPAQRKEILSAARTLEALMGDNPQQQVNAAWAIKVMGNGLGLALKSEIRDVAIHRNTFSVSTDEAKKLFSVTLGMTPTQLGTITLTNKTKRTFHHCLLITRLVADRARIAEMASQEDNFGKVLGGVLPANMVEASREAARLRYLFDAQDKGVVIYLPEIAAEGAVTTTLAAPDYYTLSRSADMSLWCDETAVENLPAENWRDTLLSMQRSAMQRGHGNGGFNNGSTGGFGNANSANSPYQAQRGQGFQPRGGYGRSTQAQGDGQASARPHITKSNIYNVFIGEMAEDNLGVQGASYVDAFLKGYPEMSAKYFPAGPESDIVDYIKGCPDVSKINLIGYSFGAEVAAASAAHFKDTYKEKVTLNALVTVDARGAAQPDYPDILRNVSVWVNVLAWPDNLNRADLRLWNKGRWAVDAQQHATKSIVALHLQHMNFEGMMRSTGAEGRQMSALDTLLAR